MSSLCHRCGASLGASELFCPNCGSPQLKFSQQAETDNAWAARPINAAPRAEGISWRDAILAALLVAIPTGLLSAVTVLSWGCCLWIMGGAVLAVVVYHRRAPAFLLEIRSGLRIGAIAGLIAAYSSLIATAAWRVFARFVLHQGNGLDEFYAAVIQQTNTMMQGNPDVQAQWHSYVQFLLTPDGRAAYTLMSAASTSAGIIFLSILGGALGVRLVAGRKTTMSNS
jgi:zinc-ribbon domain